MDDFEIHPYSEYDFSTELTTEEKKILDEFVDSFRATFFKKGTSPDKALGIGILKYQGTILRTNDNSKDISEKIKILFLLLKLHISHDFFNPGMSHVDVKSFDIFPFNVGNNQTIKFGNMSDCNSVHTTIPENISGIANINFYPIHFCTNPIPVELKIFNGGDEIFGINPKILDLTYLYKGLSSNLDYYQKFLNIATVHYGLEHQADLFFYYSIIPSILEILLQLNSQNIKKKEAIDYGKILDSKLVKENENIETVTYIHPKKGAVKENLGIIARTFVNIYDLRNDFLHEGKRAFNKLKVTFKGTDLKIYDIFQLIFKYSILNDFVDQGIINNEFIKLEFNGNMFTTGGIEIESKQSELIIDAEMNVLIQKANSDKQYGIT